MNRLLRNPPRDASAADAKPNPNFYLRNLCNLRTSSFLVLPL